MKVAYTLDGVPTKAEGTPAEVAAHFRTLIDNGETPIVTQRDMAGLEQALLTTNASNGDVKITRFESKDRPLQMPVMNFSGDRPGHVTQRESPKSRGTQQGRDLDAAGPLTNAEKPLGLPTL